MREPQQARCRFDRPTRSWRATAQAAILALTVVLVGCGGGDGGGNEGPAEDAVSEIRKLGIEKYQDAQEPVRTSSNGAWTSYHYDPAEEKAVCFNGSEYQLSVHKGDPDSVLLYLEGGGACWDFSTCYVLGIAKSTANGVLESGIIDLDDQRNPFKDFSIVYAPYCDASVWSGDKIVDYNGRRTIHHGRWNLGAAITAIKKQLGSPKRIVVSGSSAGGYGTFAGYVGIRGAFPDADIVWLNDSGPGIQNLAASEDVRNRAANWGFQEVIPQSCTECFTKEQYTYLIDWALKRDRTLRVGLYSTQQDSTIRTFLGLDGPQFQNLLFEVTDDVARRQPERFKRYFPGGAVHTVLELPIFYTVNVNGQSLLDWTNALLDGTTAWTDQIQP